MHLFDLGEVICRWSDQLSVCCIKHILISQLQFEGFVTLHIQHVWKKFCHHLVHEKWAVLGLFVPPWNMVQPCFYVHLLHFTQWQCSHGALAIHYTVSFFFLFFFFVTAEEEAAFKGTTYIFSKAFVLMLGTFIFYFTKSIRSPIQYDWSEFIINCTTVCRASCIQIDTS